MIAALVVEPLDHLLFIIANACSGMGRSNLRLFRRHIIGCGLREATR